MPDEKALGALTGNIHGYKCPRCQKSWGYIFMEKTGAMYFCGDKSCLTDDKNASFTLERSKEKKVERDAAREFSIGSNYVNACLAKWNVSTNYQNLARDWTKSPVNFLVYQGIPGAGKTYFCAAIANYLFSQNKEPRYIHIRDFLDNCKKTFDMPGGNQEEYIRALSSCDILIIDDLGSTMNTEFQKETILSLIDKRYSNNAPTIITTNFDKKIMEEVLGERITRRVYDESKIITKDQKYAK